MPKLQLKPSPTFKVKVGIPVPGAKPEPVEFIFKNRNRDDLAAWLEGLDGKNTEDAVLEIASGWDLEDAFDAENVKLLLSNYIGAWQAVYDTYMRELVQAKVKN
ncbi:phage tail assembly chaperone [Methylibium sp.]|uniref:phage tail assembly chaperone n=1 Tax=Methylibium sp. TaxID=2067992 RepID=UPI00184B4111|nr:phage tail assembly chaperone [Methylibium sp.]MBA3588303.1 hypothetical protein [Methylibium sp.]